MAKSPKLSKEEEGWDRFERAVDIALKTPPMHRTSTDKKPKRTTKTKKD